MGITNPTIDKTLSSWATNWREGRRFRAFELKKRGWKQTEIADSGSQRRGHKPVDEACHTGGGGRLEAQASARSVTRRSDQERAQLPELLAQGAEAHGFRGEVWTCERVAIVIRKEIGVSYHPAHVSRVVRGLGLSLQKPMPRANQRDEQAKGHWKEQRWPELKKEP
jgi:transposase